LTGRDSPVAWSLFLFMAVAKMLYGAESGFVLPIPFPSISV
jgi:hypothetical protein